MFSAKLLLVAQTPEVNVGTALTSPMDRVNLAVEDSNGVPLSVTVIVKSNTQFALKFLLLGSLEHVQSMVDIDKTSVTKHLLNLLKMNVQSCLQQMSLQED